MSINEIAYAICSSGADLSIEYDKKTRKFFVRSSIEIQAGCLTLNAKGSGNKPEEAILDFWKDITNIGEQHFLIINEAARVRWNGFMWEAVKVSHAETNTL